MKPDRPDVIDIDVGRRPDGGLRPTPERSTILEDRLFPDIGEVDVARIAKGVLSRWRSIAFIAILVAAAGIYPIYVMMRPNYVSRAAVSAVERTALLDEAWAPTPGPRLNESSLLELVESRRVMDRAKADIGEAADLQEMRRRIGVEWPRDQDMFFITAGHETPELAQRWADAATRAFVDLQHERFRDELDASIQRLELAAVTGKAELDAKNQAVVQFRTDYRMTGTDSAPEELIKQLIEMEGRIAELRALGKADESAAGAIRKDEEKPPPVVAPPEGTDAVEDGTAGGSGGGMPRSTWRRRVRALRRELADLEERYTAEHPRVEQARKELAQLLQLERTGRVQSSQGGSGTAGGTGGSRRPPGWSEAEMTISAAHRLRQAESLEKAAQEVRDRIDAFSRSRRQLEVLESEAAVAKVRWQTANADLEKARALRSLRAPLFDVVESAALPDRPEGGKRRVVAAGLFFLGLLLGGGRALYKEVRDTSVREASDIERLGLPVLAHAILGPASVGRSTHREAIRLAAQTLRREAPRDAATFCVLVTSANEEEGKTQIAADICKELIRWGEGVVIVDGNLRAGDSPTGLLDGFLVGRETALVPSSDEWGIPTVSSGRVGEEAPDLLSRPSLRRALRLAASRGFREDEERGDMAGPGFAPASARNNLCIVDGPAFLPSVDAELLAEASDAVLLVVRRGHTRIEQVRDVQSRLQDADRRLVGAVLTASDTRRGVLARVLLGPKRSLLFALAGLAALGLGLGGCGPSRVLADDTIEDSNDDLRQDDVRFQLVPTDDFDLAPYRMVPDFHYTIGAGDVLELVVIGYPEMSRGGVLVRPDGRIGVPLLGDVVVAGLTPEAAGKMLTEHLGTYLKGPFVTVLVQQAQNAKVLVLGRVANPGSFVLQGPTKLLEMLARAGGLAYRDEVGSEPIVADLGRATVMRGDRVIPVDFTRLLVGGDQDQNVYLEPGDIIHLPPLHERDVLVLGEVQSPTVLRYDTHLSIASALARAGGVTVDARTGAVRVIRGSLARPRVYLVDVDDVFAAQRMDVPLMPGDIVYVTTTAIADWNRLLQQIMPTVQALLTTRYLIEGTPRPLYELGQ